ncbi:hypothetical protein Syun_010633 [Stephania yunnanensis]|uniref:Uncharacterized protein n=1 Tax=Stephania yunnanensis TaxID=152371 RepID=A0AAP0KIY6_9MAGN
MRFEANGNSTTTTTFGSPSKALRGTRGLCSHESYSAEEIINDDELALRKAELAARRRYEATEWLRRMDHGASEVLQEEPSEEEFCLALRNGLILCNVLNKVNPGAVSKVVENPVVAVQSSDGAAQSAIQYFENMRNFLVAVGDMKLLTFEASDLEKGGSSVKVVDCILCLKGYHEWKQAGGIGVWRYGGTVKIVSLQKSSQSSLINDENADESCDDSDLPYDQQLSEFLRVSSEVSDEKAKVFDALTLLFDRYGLGLLQAYLADLNGFEELPLNAMHVDAVLRNVVKGFTGFLVSHGNQLGFLLKEMLKTGTVTKAEFIEVIAKYLAQRTGELSNDLSPFCICGGKLEVRLDMSHVERLDKQQNQLKDLKTAFQETKGEVREIQSGWETELKRLEQHIKSLEGASSSYHKLLEENRSLFNQVQDLKGSIRVYCRVRPFLPGQSNGQSIVDYIGENGNLMIVNPHKQGKDARKVFSFNKVFGAATSQEQVFADTQPLIKSVLDGFNVCIFAYGQTGSGKTYTMSGPDLMTKETWGVNYRALNDLFQISKSRIDVITYEVSVQMIEIYNEQVRDLLVSDGSGRRLDILNNCQPNGLNVPDACLVPVKCTQDVLDLMKIGHRNRAVGATALNERSSRSHSVLTVHVHGRELVSGSVLRGCLHLVDLAGSERVDKSEAVGERLREAQHINRSLSALGDVISSLAQKSKHIPYRNSKLTQVLQDALGGQAKTLMFVHINPDVESIGETISTLKFAERVASIELGAARSNKETGEIRELKEEISNLKSALERKEAELEQIRSARVQTGPDLHKSRAVSPMHIPRLGLNASLKSEITQRPTIDFRSNEVRSSSSGKQRRSRFPIGALEKDPIPKLAFLTEESSMNNGRPRSPSPPIRRSISTDRGSAIKSRVKLDALDNQPAVKLQFPARVAVNKSAAAIPVIPAAENISRGNVGPQLSTKEENISDTLYNLQRNNWRRSHPDNDDEQFKQVLNVRQGGIRKSRPEIKAKVKNQFPTRLQKSDAALALLSEAEAGKAEDAPKSTSQREKMSMA